MALGALLDKEVGNPKISLRDLSDGDLIGILRGVT